MPLSLATSNRVPEGWRDLIISAMSNLAPLGRDPNTKEFTDEIHYLSGEDMGTVMEILGIALAEGFLEYDDHYRLILGPAGEEYVQLASQVKVEETRRLTLRRALKRFKDKRRACRYLSLGDKALYDYYYYGGL